VTVRTGDVGNAIRCQYQIVPEQVVLHLRHRTVISPGVQLTVDRIYYPGIFVRQIHPRLTAGCRLARRAVLPNHQTLNRLKGLELVKNSKIRTTKLCKGGRRIECKTDSRMLNRKGH